MNTKLGDILTEIIDCEHKTAPEASTESYAFSVGTPHLREGRILYDQAKPISQETYEEWTKRGRPEAGDLILAREAPVGQVGLIGMNYKVALGQRTVLLKVNRDVCESRYLHYKMLSDGMQRKMVDWSEGSTVQHLNVRDIPKLELGYLPEMLEQKRIAEILGSVDDKIEANSRLVEKLTRLIDLQVEQARGTASGTLKISDLAVHSKAQILPSKSTDASVLHYSLPAFDSGMVAAEEEAEAILSNKFILSKPVVLFSKLNPGTPRIWMVEPDQEKYSFASTEFVVLQPKEGIGLGTLWAACRDSRVTRRLIELARGTSTSHQRVSPQDILDSEVVLPAIPEAEAELIRQLIAQNNSLVKTRDLLIRHLIG